MLLRKYLREFDSYVRPFLPPLPSHQRPQALLQHAARGAVEGVAALGEDVDDAMFEEAAAMGALRALSQREEAVHVLTDLEPVSPFLLLSSLVISARKRSPGESPRRCRSTSFAHSEQTKRCVPTPRVSLLTSRASSPMQSWTLTNWACSGRDIVQLDGGPRGP